MKPDIKFERFLDQFVTGGLVLVGAWYLHRPLLQKYFPIIAGGAVAGANSVIDVDILLLLFALGSITLGVLITHSADLAVVASTRPVVSGDDDRWKRRCLRVLLAPFTFGAAPDPRVRAIRRYLQSPRSDEFLQLLHTWAMTSKEALDAPSEAVIAHEHIVARLRALGGDSRLAVAEAYEPVTFAASLFISLAALFTLAVLSFWSASSLTAARPNLVVRPLQDLVRGGICALLYVATVVAAESLRRRFRDFSGNVITIAFHTFLIQNSNIRATGSST